MFVISNAPYMVAVLEPAFCSRYQVVPESLVRVLMRIYSTFPLLGQALGDRVVLMLALEGGAPVAGALNLMGEDTLYGRNWGCDREYPFLHFELCYYRAIDFAIEHGLARVEAGAQGEHKIQRGYLPAETYSAHWIRHPGLRDAVADFLVQERAARVEEMKMLATLGPFRRAGEASD